MFTIPAKGAQPWTANLGSLHCIASCNTWADDAGRTNNSATPPSSPACSGAIHNKPDHWLCHTDHLPGPLAQLAQRPSAATLSRRGRSTPVLQLIEQCVQALLTLHALGRSRVKLIDAMPLRVGFGSHDRTARFGYGGGGKARGYKLMVILDACTGLVEDWLVMPMNVDEAKAARQLVGRMPRGQYLIGDNLFDKNHLYDLAATRGVQLIAPPKRSARGLGHRPHSPAPCMPTASCNDAWAQN